MSKIVLAKDDLLADSSSHFVTIEEEAEARGRLGGRYGKYESERRQGKCHSEALTEAVKP